MNVHAHYVVDLWKWNPFDVLIFSMHKILVIIWTDSNRSENCVDLLSLSKRFYVTLSMLAWVGWLLPGRDQVASHSNHIPRAALPFSSNNSFCRSRDGRGMVIAIHGDDWCKSLLGQKFTCPSWRQTLLWDWPIINMCADNVGWYCF